MNEINILKRRLDEADAAVDTARAGVTAANVALGAELRKLRLGHAVSQTEMGRRMAACASEISTIECGRKHITARRLERYLAALAIPGS